MWKELYSWLAYSGAVVEYLIVSVAIWCVIDLIMLAIRIV